MKSNLILSRSCSSTQGFSVRLNSAAIVLGFVASLVGQDFRPAPQAFRQEVARSWSLSSGATGPALSLVCIDAQGQLRVSDGSRWFKPRGEQELEVLPAPQGVAADAGWIHVHGADQVLDRPLSQLRQVFTQGEAVWLATAKGAVRRTREGAEAIELSGYDVRQLASASNGALLAATDDGLWQRRSSNDWERVRIPDNAGRSWGERDVRGVAVDRKGGWWVATTAGIAAQSEGKWSFYTGREGLPYADFTCVAIGEGSDVWFGTTRGAIRFDGREWAYRQGRRWLPGDQVKSIAVSPEGRVWLGTDKGLGCIERKPMTLADKAAHYEGEVERYIKRTPLGYVSEVHLRAPGDRSQVVYSDSDNDGLWTAMYGAGECFAYAATKQPEFKQRAQSAFEALRFLQKVTQGGSNSPPKGFVARTIRPVDWPNPNQGRLEGDRESQKHDRLWKVYEPRWPLSADGKWYWKSDTSSDELDGHFFLYATYYHLVAESETERDRVREVVRDLADHLVAHDFQLIDHDGRVTRWGVFGPRDLNQNPDWWFERGLNSLSILSYLAVAESITGDPKYGQAAHSLVENHGYGANVMNPKTQLGIGSGNQSDDEMAFMCFYNLLKFTREDNWREKWRFAFYAYWTMEQPERNPFFNFAYAAAGRGKAYTNAYGTSGIDPWEGWLEDSLATLRGFSLDRANWEHRNHHRLDLILLPVQQTEDLASLEGRQRGYRTDGKVLPVEERHFGHWNTDPWRLDYGGNGQELASGTVFLLPYYMGLYHGFIARPGS